MKKTYKLLSFVLACCLLVGLMPIGTFAAEAPITSDTEIKVLGIGNSFTVDSLAYFPTVAKAMEYPDVTVGQLMLGGCSLETHASYATNNTASYEWTYYQNGSWSQTAANTTMQTALNFADWDVIVIQQVSGFSGMPGSYEPYLTTLINYIKNLCPNAKLYWNMTWAYQSDSTHVDFARYNNDQQTMYNAIIDALSVVDAHPEIEGIIPTGTAIQNIRTGVFGDNVTRDGYHLNLDHGRYTAAITWFAALTGKSIAELDYDLNGKLSDAQLETIRMAVAAAMDTPRAVTDCSQVILPSNLTLVANGATANGFYLKSDDTLPATGWSVAFTAENGTNNGIFVNDEKKAAVMKKVDKALWYVSLADGGVTATAGTTVSIKGVFAADENVCKFNEIKLAYDGSAWSVVLNTGLETDRTFTLSTQNGNANGFFVFGNDTMLSKGWDTTIEAAAGDENGVFVNGAKTSVYLKKIANDQWYVCLADRGATATDGTVVTLKGGFVFGNKTYVFNPASFRFDGTKWSEVESTDPIEPTAVEVQLTGFVTPTEFNADKNQHVIYFSTSAPVPGGDGHAFTCGWPPITVKKVAADGSVSTETFGVAGGPTSHRNGLFLKIPADKIPSFDDMAWGDEYYVTFPKGLYDIVDADSVNFTEDYTFMINHQGYFTQAEMASVSSTVVKDITNIPAASSATGLYFNVENVAAMPSAGDWTQAYVDLSSVEAAKDLKGGATMRLTHTDGTVTDYTIGYDPSWRLKKISDSQFYLGGFGTAVAGDVLTLDGYFYARNAGTWNYNDNKTILYHFNNLKFAFDGTAWTDISSVTYAFQGDFNGVLGWASTFSAKDARWNVYLTNDFGIDSTWDYKYKNFTYVIDGVAYTAQASSTDVGGTLYFSIPATVLPGDAEKTVTVKAGEYLASGRKDKNLKVLNDFTVFATDGHVETAPTYYQIGNIVGFSGDSSATAIYFFTDSLSGLPASWDNNFTAADDDSGILFNDEPIENPTLKMVHCGDVDNFYLNIKNTATAGDTVTIGGTFQYRGTSTTQRIVIAETVLTFDGAKWSTPRISQDVTLVGAIKKYSVINAAKTRWAFYIQTNGNVPGNNWCQFADAVVTVNGTPVTVTMANSAPDVANALYFGLDLADIPAGNVVVTVKAGTYLSKSPTVADLCITNDLNIYLIDGEIGNLAAGDANFDFTVDVRDLVRIKRYLADQNVAADFGAMDMDGSGEVDATDVALLKHCLLSDIVLLTPANGAQVAAASKDVADFIDGFDYNVRENVSKQKNLYYRDDVVLNWYSANADTTYTVLVSENADMSDALRFVTDKTALSVNNLNVDTDYYWQVVCSDFVSEILSFHTADTVRTMKIDGVSNTRDIGGWATADGHTVKYGMAYRGARVSSENGLEITASGLDAMLNVLKIKTDLDVRTPGEGGAGGTVSPLGDTVNYYNYNGAYYIGPNHGIDDPTFQSNLAGEVRTFANPANYPIYFHCSVGRDRTGTLALMINGLLGVSKNDLFLDYELSMLSVSGSASSNDNFNELINAFTNMYNYVQNFAPNGTFAEATESYLLSIGITQTEIDTIRSLMLD